MLGLNIPYYLVFYTLAHWGSLVTVIYFKKMFLWGGLREAQLCVQQQAIRSRFNLKFINSVMVLAFLNGQT